MRLGLLPQELGISPEVESLMRDENVMWTLWKLKRKLQKKKKSLWLSQKVLTAFANYSVRITFLESDAVKKLNVALTASKQTKPKRPVNGQVCLCPWHFEQDERSCHQRSHLHSERPSYMPIIIPLFIPLKHSTITTLWCTSSYKVRMFFQT